MKTLMNGKKALRYSAIAEAVTLVALVCIAVPLKYMADFPYLVKVIGPIHGAMFVLFLLIVMRSWGAGLIGGFGAFRLAIGSIIPFGGFLNERWLNKQFAIETE